MVEFTYGAVTDTGDVRPENQDSVLCVTGIVGGQSAGLFLVADGMGGLSHGSEVSQYIIGQFARWWQEDFPAMIQAGHTSREDMKELLEQEIWDINQAVPHFRNEMQCRLGSTLSLLLFYAGNYYIENLGDSRVYRMREGELTRLTEDQSLVAQMVREKRMTEEEARYSGKKNVLTMCLGMFAVPQIFSVQGEVEDGDKFLLCSDGLYNPLEEVQIGQVLCQFAGTSEEKGALLKEDDTSGMAHDNVSAIVVEQMKGDTTCYSKESD